MKISIIVPAFNEEKLLPGTLRAIRDSAIAFAESGWEWQTIVCDNNSTDRTGEVAREAGAIVVFEPVNQISRARNAGAAVAAGEWLVFVDADSLPGAPLFRAMADHLRDARVIAGGCLVRQDVESLAADAITALWNRISSTMRWVAGSFIFCRAAADVFHFRLGAHELVVILGGLGLGCGERRFQFGDSLFGGGRSCRRIGRHSFGRRLGGGVLNWVGHGKTPEKTSSYRN